MARLRLLGGARIEAEEGPVEGSATRRHPLALLAVLACAPSRTVARSRAVGLLWPESSEEKARGRLNSCLYRVRQELGEGAVVSVGDELRLDIGVLPCDVVEFETALEEDEPERAVALYEGPLLEGFRLPDSTPFEKWLDRAREGLHRRWSEALEELAEAAEARGDSAGAVRWWRERSSADPYDSRVVHRLMEALARSGSPAAALSAARVHRKLLEEELGTEPGEELTALAERLKRGVGPEATEVREKAVRETAAPPEERDPSPAVRGPGGPVERSDTSVDRSPPRGPSRRTVVGAGVALLLTVAAALWVATWDRGGLPAAPADRSIAVLPFQPLGEEPAVLLAEGLHADLLTRLSSIGSLTVVSGTSVRRYRNGAEPIGAIAAELGVDWVVEGSVQRAGDAIQINVQLVDALADAHSWAQTYRRPYDPDDPGGVFEIQAEVANRVADQLGARITPAERRRVERDPTDDLAAFRLYVEGRRHLDERTPERIQSAVGTFRSALQRDSGYALAWAGLADAVDLARTYDVELSTAVPDPETAARRAVELDPELAEARVSLGRAIFRDRLPVATREFRRAVELRPSYAQAHHWLGYLELAFGDLTRAGEHIALAVQLNPRLLPARGNMARIQLAEGRYEEALETAREVQGAASEWMRGAAVDELVALAHLGRWEVLRDRVEHHRAVAGSHSMGDAMLALADAAEGDTGAARRRLAGIEHGFWAGLVHAALGDLDAAFAFFDQDAEDAPRGPWYVTAWRYYFPDVLGPVRGDPRFAALMRDVRARWGIEPDEDLSPA